MGWLIALGILLLIGILPVGVRLVYGEDTATIRLTAGPFRYRIYPRKRQAKPPAPEKRETPAKKEKKEPAEKKKGGNIRGFFPLVKILLDFLGDFRRKIRVDRLELRITLGSGDPCDLAVMYGNTWAVAGNLFPWLERLFTIRKKTIRIDCDFTADQTTVYGDLWITITVARALALLLKYGWRAVKELLKIKNANKGGAKHE